MLVSAASKECLKILSDPESCTFIPHLAITDAQVKYYSYMALRWKLHSCTNGFEQVRYTADKAHNKEPHEKQAVVLQLPDDSAKPTD